MSATTARLGYLAALVLLLLAPAAIYPVLIMKVLCFALFACAFNLLLGYTGLLSFGHAVFLGSAAYLTGHALSAWGLPTLVGLAVGTAAAALLGLVIGALAIRRQGIYFAMITLALAQMMYFVFLQSPFTGGENGLQGVPRGSLAGIDLSNDYALYYLVVALFAAAFWLILRTIHSPFGQALKAIRENEARAVSLGYDVDRYKLLAFVLSAGLSGLAGALKVLVFGFATLTDVHWHTSGEVVLMTLLGGMGTVMGPVVGAGVVVLLQTELADKVGSLVTVIMGALFVFCVLVFRRGIVGESVALYRRMIGEKTR
ncbi:branched-chain amino acid ABC transporter permease [Thauera sp. CAU 1555]|uniref:Branched-chain amino acid ABC transporter permease n=1 Tax=Thauera sedimentorum TaxID=2767595 RepID=A0ABR9B7M7_9RHOO|nr:branched-chain amino acid ABC transporter permease [Thauera sedimentorum]MBC9071444.1 branched-chain amino acid ABC transporter permease [Thauera sedimentorum]MBD8502363.1 branched-chain amino acid ABC transporter permease [Thauera sedimentorum]